MESKPAPSLKLTLEIGGNKQNSQPSKLPPSAKKIMADKLPNPYTPIGRQTLEASPPVIFDWMTAKDPTAVAKIDEMIVQAKTAFNTGRSVRVECYGGAHRSQTVAWLILRALEPGLRERVEVDALDAELLPAFK